MSRRGGLSSSCSFLGSIGQVVKGPNMSEAERDAKYPPANYPLYQYEGVIIYNTDTDTLQYFTGTEWKDCSGGTGDTSMNTFQSITFDAAGVTKAGYLEVIASTSEATKRIQIFDAAGLNLIWAVGAIGSEVDKFVSGPGSNESTDIAILIGQRISVKADALNVNPPYIGVIAINLLN